MSKDKEARRMIVRLASNVGVGVVFDGKPSIIDSSTFLYCANALLKELGSISIKDCPMCKHPVLALYHKPNVAGHLAHPEVYDEGNYFQCLTCGSKFRCVEKKVCELIKKN